MVADAIRRGRSGRDYGFYDRQDNFVFASAIVHLSLLRFMWEVAEILKPAKDAVFRMTGP